MNYTEFAQKIKVKYPEYQEMDDLELSKKIVSKYPEYKDVVEFGQPIPTEVPESQPTEIPLNESETPKGTPVNVGLAQSAFLGTSFGTAPLIAGGADVARNLAKKVVPAKLPEFLQKQKDLVLGTDNKNIGESFKGGRERFLESQQQYAKQAPIAAMLAEIAGGFALPIGSLGGVAKGLSVLGKIKKSAKAGAVLGEAYGLGTGLSQTKDKVLDIEEGLKGGLFGAGVGALGGVLGSAIPTGISKLFQSKYKGIPSAYIRPKGTQIKTVENLIENPLVRKEAMRGDLGMRYAELSKDVAKDIIDLPVQLKTIISQEYAKVPKDTKINLAQNRTLEKMNDAILDFEKHTKSYPRPEEVEKATNILNNIKPVVSKKVLGELVKPAALMQEAKKYASANEFIYAIQTKKSKIDVDDFYKYAQTIKEPQKKDFATTVDYVQALRKYNNLQNGGWFGQAEDVWEKSQKAPKKSISEYSMSFESLKDAADDLYDLSRKAYNNGDTKASNLYKNMRKILVESRDTNPLLKKNSKLYNDLENVKETLETGLGIKLDNPKNIEGKIFSSSRDASGEYAANQIEEVADILNKYPETKHLSGVKDKIQIAQTAYDLRPAEESKILAQIKDNPLRALTLPLKLLEEPAAQTMAKKLAKNIESGKLSPEDLKSFDIIKGGTALNKFIQKQKAYGGTIPTMANAVKKLQLSRYTLPRITIKELLKEKE